MSLYRSDTSRRIVKTGPVQAPGPWKLDTSREDFRYSFEQQSPCGVVSRLGLEPRNLAVPDFKSVLQFAVRGFTKTQYTNRSGAFTSFANGSYLEL